MIRAENLTKKFQDITAVDSINVSIDKGDVFGFLGPNGAGKTTVINMMTGIIVPTSGRCYIHDMDIVEKPIEVKKIIGYLPDNPGFYNNLTGRQTLEYFSYLFGIEKDERDKRTKKLLSRVGLSGVNCKVGDYSRGMRQRLGIAQALINDPEVIFLDEPSTGLDPEGMKMLRELIHELAASGKTTFFSTHVIEDVPQVCNKIGIISAGKVIATGSPEEVRHKLRGIDCRNIVVKVKGKMPELSTGGIINIRYFNDGAIIQTRGNITEQISIEITRKGSTIIELNDTNGSMGDLFFNVIYKGDPDEN